MEEAAEVVWGRFLEAENASVVLMGVSRDLIAQHQLFQYNLSGFNQREDGFRLKLENCIKLLNTKDASIEKLNSRITQLVADNLEINLAGKVPKLLEEKINISETNFSKGEYCKRLTSRRVTEMEI
ncbi:WPP domain-interacting tail-anchored protein 2 [Tanacetum coccineum]